MMGEDKGHAKCPTCGTLCRILMHNGRRQSIILGSHLVPGTHEQCQTRFTEVE
jgi:hypothetical protein